MAAATKRGDRFVGLHFFNPVPLMPLVEVVRTVTTSAETFQRAFAFARSLGKEPVAAKDNSGKREGDRKSTRLNSSHGYISYAVFCLKKKKKTTVTKNSKP